MALPSTGPITLAQVASELGVTVTGVNLNQSNVRTLAAKASGTIGMSDLRGKSGVSNFAPTISPTSDTDYLDVGAAGNHIITYTVTPVGGVGPYTYLWTTTVGTIPGATTNASVGVRYSWTKNGSYYDGEVRCICTDAQGTQRTLICAVHREYYGGGILA